MKSIFYQLNQILEHVNGSRKILQWLSKLAHEHQTGKKQDKEVNANGILFLNKNIAEQTRLKCKSCSLFKFFRRKDIAKAYFYNTLHLKRLGSSRRRQHFVRSMNMKRENLSRGLSPSHRSDSGAHLGSTKVLPISSDHAAQSASENGNRQCPKPEKKDKTKTISKMKELLRWAAATKSEKSEKFLGRKVFRFRDKTTLKPVPDDDQLSNDSPKISFRWDVESCSTISSTYSEISSIASSTRNDQSGKRNALSLSSTPANREQQGCRTGNWITTDSELNSVSLMNSRGARTLNTNQDHWSGESDHWTNKES
nr:uncharacterized protein LOC109158333 [Ipomoea batatas]